MSKKNKTPKSAPPYNYTATPKYDKGDILIFNHDSTDDLIDHTNKLMVLEIEEYWMNAGFGNEKYYRYLALALDTGTNMKYSSWYVDYHYDKEA